MFEYFKERRLAAVFYTTLLTLIGGLALAEALHIVLENNLIPGDWPLILGAIGFIFGTFAWRWARQRRALRRWGRYQPSPLSEDERVKARRKLSARATTKRR